MADAALATAPEPDKPVQPDEVPLLEAAEHHQALWRLRRERKHQSRDLAGRSARAARRERRRQIDAGEDDLRPAAAERGRVQVAGAAGHAGRPGRRPRARHRHGVPALQPVRATDRRRERRARSRQCVARRHRRARARSLEVLWASARSAARGVAAVGRRTPAHRDRALPAAGPQAADPRRADLGADPAGGRATVPDAACAAQGRPRHPLHLAQARRGARAVRHRHDPARRQGDRNLRPSGRNRAVARQHDGRRRGRRGALGRLEKTRAAAAHRARSQRHAGRSAWREARRRPVRACGRRNPRRRGRRRQRAGRVVRGALRRGAVRTAPTSSRSTARTRAASRSPSAAASARPSCRRNGSATRPRRASRSRTTR